MIQLLDPVKLKIVIIIIIALLTGNILTLTALEILFLPHETQNPSSIADINTRQGLIERGKFFKNKTPLRRTTFRASDESGPDEAFEVGVRIGDEADLRYEVCGDESVVERETDVCPGGREAFSGA